MSEFSKRNKTKKVVFKKDYLNIYKKGETHYVHEDTVKLANLDKYGDVSDVDFKTEFKKAAKQAKKQD